MTRRIVTKTNGEPVYVIRNTHPAWRFAGRVLLGGILIGLPLGTPIPEPWSYILVPVLYILEIVLVYILWPKRNRRASRDGLSAPKGRPPWQQD